MVCIICFESLFKSQGTEGAVYANTRHSDEDLAERPAALTCGHVFHKECIEEWFHRPEGPKCPLCQKLPMDIPRILFVDLDEDDVERFLSEEQLARKRKMESELGRRVQKIFDIIAESKEFDDEEIFELTMQVTGLSDQIESAERKLAERQEECATIGTKIEHLEGVVASSDKRLESLTAAAKAKRRQREYRELKILFS
ncbi:hypothetical protein LPJ73_001028 [Coemansia sp. RSA 2703]|nr:hypothetical protein LPJ73_001028 [Coemansia sp. RSA 2703]KAJ2363826.1 hypothetical protein IW150_006643 [Coemansia sp. RSA 2607]KAJ2382157.1 hypothetical protein GGI05_005746 [Coemansia sp. RSA 2603]